MSREDLEATAPLDFGDLSPRHEPALPSEAIRPFEEAALIGGERLRTDGYFVNIVKRAPAAPDLARARTVLVVEDDPGTSAVIVAILGREGFLVRAAQNLQGVLKGVNALPRPDAILLDVLLPDANGFAILERLKRHPELSGTPVVMLTSLSEPADVAKGLALGASGYLSKPARPKGLIAALRDVLGL